MKVFRKFLLPVTFRSSEWLNCKLWVNCDFCVLVVPYVSRGGARIDRNGEGGKRRLEWNTPIEKKRRNTCWGLSCYHFLQYLLAPEGSREALIQWTKADGSQNGKKIQRINCKAVITLSLKHVKLADINGVPCIYFTKAGYLPSPAWRRAWLWS